MVQSAHGDHSGSGIDKTPPVGTGVYMISGVAKDTPLEVVFKGVLTFLLAFAVCLSILIAFPQISLFLPRLME